MVWFSNTESLFSTVNVLEGTNTNVAFQINFSSNSGNSNIKPISLNKVKMIADFPKTNYTVKDVAAQDFIRAYADYLKKTDKIEVPKWLDFVKTATGRELAPLESDWLYVRIAAIARKVYLKGHVGVGTLKHIYGSKKRFGVRKPHHITASGKIIRYALQALEKLDVVKKDKKSALKRLSRVITERGQKDLDVIANQIGKAKYKKTA